MAAVVVQSLVLRAGRVVSPQTGVPEAALATPRASLDQALATSS